MEIKNLRLLGDELRLIRVEMKRANKIQEDQLAFQEKQVRKPSEEEGAWRQVKSSTESDRYPLVNFNPKKLNIL